MPNEPFVVLMAEDDEHDILATRRSTHSVSKKPISKTNQKSRQNHFSLDFSLFTMFKSFDLL